MAVSQHCNIHNTSLHHQDKLALPHPPIFLINLGSYSLLSLALLNYQAIVLSDVP